LEQDSKGSVHLTYMIQNWESDTEAAKLANANGRCSMMSSNSVLGDGFKMVRALLFLCAMIVVLSSASLATTSVKMNVWASPSSGVSGQSSVNASGTGFPAGNFSPANITVSLAKSCGGTVVASTPASSEIKILGTADRVHFLIPSGLATGLYFVTISDTADGFNSGSTCSKLNVTGVSAGLNACVPSSSLGVDAPVKPGPVSAYVPLGSWGGGPVGVKVVQVETGGGPVVPPALVGTPGTVNSCAANPATGEAVCTENSSNVDIIKGSTLSATLTSASNYLSGFSGGDCNNCGVAMDSLNNRAAIAMGFTPSPSGSAIQFLNLATNTFASPITLVNEISEDILVDPTRALILSPNETSNYDVVQTTKAGAGTEFSNAITSPSLTLDSAGEDCSTGIAMSVGEFSNDVYLGDLTQAVFTPGSPAGTWTAPESETSIIGSYSAGLSGTSVAQGSSHLAVVTGEFGGSSYAVVLLPSTSGSGTPNVVDYAFVPSITCGNPPCSGGYFTAGFDPHTVTAYTSGNNGKAYALFSGYNYDSTFTIYAPTVLAQVDMACVLAAPRAGDGHTVASVSDSDACTTLIGPF
jgi:hypothetical protein